MIIKNSFAVLRQWHLNGSKRDKKAFGAPDGRSFGFDDTKYQWGAGHWKFMDEVNSDITGYKYAEGMKKFANSTKTAYTTDFLTDRAIEIIKKQKKPFALMLSLPDPHGKCYEFATFYFIYTDLRRFQ